MNKKRIEQSLKTTVEQTTPNVLDNIFSLCGNQDGKVIKMKNTTKKTLIKTAIALAASFAIIIGGFAIYNNINKAKDDLVYSTVTFDVNPSLEISVNENEKVIDIKALNNEAEVILDGKDFKDASLDAAVDVIIESMVYKGYIDEFSNSILISVNSKNDAHGKALEQKLNRNVGALLNTNDFSGSVLSHTVKHTDDLDKKAEKYGITIGKAKLINDIISADNRYTFEELVPLTINELNLICNSGEKLSSSINVTGTASDKEYINADQAKKIALDYLGISVEKYSNNTWYCFYRYENNRIIYELSLYFEDFEYIYDIDATNGEIIKAERIIDGTNNANSATENGIPITFKEEIFDNFSLTYDDFVKKYGKETGRAWDSGSLFCEFENGAGQYAFSSSEHDEIKGTDKCYAMRLNAKNVFNNFDKKIAITDLAKGVNCEIVTAFNEMNGDGYLSTFKYKEYTVMFNTDDKKLIDENTIISIVIK